MFKNALLMTLSLAIPSVFAAQNINLYQAPLDSLKDFNQSAIAQDSSRAAKTPEVNALKEVSTSFQGRQDIIRYQQTYQGIPVVGAQVTVTRQHGLARASDAKAEVNGHLLKDIQLNIKPDFDVKKAIEFAKKDYFSTHPDLKTQDEKVELQIRPVTGDELQLVYLVSFKSLDTDLKPVWPFYVIDAHSGVILKHWNNIKNIEETGPGGNEKVREYWYGKDGLPALEVAKNGDTCTMETPAVRLVDLKSVWDWSSLNKAAYAYTCHQAREDQVNGAFSPRNDAYYFGHLIVNMYRDWYGVNALQRADGQPMQLMMRVHFGSNYDNAFWDGTSMTFGDGQEFYPLVSLDVAGHEVTHGFTEQHSNLEYHDESGALNESLSDMAGQASRAYLLEKSPQLYAKAYMSAQNVTWGIGETITRGDANAALRYMDNPSRDGQSADCVDKALAAQHGAACAISYTELVAFANASIGDPEQRQGFIVHTASGVFNKAFFLLSQRIGIKSAYHLMLVANSKYWNPTTNFVAGACGVIHAGRDLNTDVALIKSVMGQVGIDTRTCAA